MNLKLGALERTLLKYGWNMAAVGASFFLSGTSVNLNQPDPAIDEAPHYLPAQQPLQAQRDYEQRFVQENCPTRKNGHPDDIYDICVRVMLKAEQNKIVDGEAHYSH